jgi:hypothetical protein
LAASLLAVGLAVGLGTISFGLFAEAPPVGKLETVLDVYTLKGGIGINTNGGTFEPGDSACVCAYLTIGGVPVNSSTATFTIRKPDGTEAVRTALTNGSGVAEISHSFLPSEGHLIGTWQILANASLNNAAVSDSMKLQCASENARIDVLPEKNGALSLSFLPSDQVFLEARLSFRNISIAGALINFSVRTPYDKEFLWAQNTSDSFGTANIPFQFPWPSDISLGTWSVTVTSQIYEQVVNATANFDCRLLPPMIDVHTQKGGQGQNTQGGSFVLNQTVLVYAEIRDSLNQTLSNRTVAFEFKCFTTTSVPWTEVTLVQETNASGIAGVADPIPHLSEYAATWVVYATTRYNDVILSDTLPFVLEQQ